MEWAALIAWVITAGGGFGLLAIWLRNGGTAAASRPGARIRPPLIFSHLGLAATGLVLWIIYIASDSDTLAWVAVIVLAPVVILGFSMVAIWIQRRQAAPAATVPATEDTPPEQHFPVPLVVGHGLLAVTTVTLAILAAAGVGS